MNTKRLEYSPKNLRNDYKSAIKDSENIERLKQVKISENKLGNKYFIESSDRKNNENSAKAFNEWYKSFYDFENNSGSKILNNLYPLENDNYQSKQNEILSKSIDSKVIFKDNIKPESRSDKLGLVFNNSLYEQMPFQCESEIISNYSNNFTPLSKERIFSNFPYVLSEAKLNPYFNSNSKLEKENSIIFNNKINQKQEENIIPIYNSNNFNNTDYHVSTYSTKNTNNKQEKFIVKLDQKVKSAKDVFLTNLNQFKNNNNQPQENKKFIEQIEDYIIKINENLDKINENESNDIKYIHNLKSNKFSLKDLLINNDKENSDLIESAKGRFIRNFINSNDSLESMLVVRDNNSPLADINNLESPNKYFLKELIQYRNHLKESSVPQFKAFKSPKDFQDKQINDEQLSSKNAIFDLIKKENSLSADYFNTKRLAEQSLTNAMNIKVKNDENENRFFNIKKEQSEISNFGKDTLYNVEKIKENYYLNNPNFNSLKLLGLKHRFKLEKETKNSRKKGFKYKMFSKEDKKFCLDLLQIFDYNAVAKLCNIPIKSLKRWAIIGPDRKKGGGRKTRDPQMEADLIKWINEKLLKGEFFDIKMIKSKALQFTKVEGFLASKGWFNKFQKKYKFVLPSFKKLKSNSDCKIFGVESKEPKQAN